MSTQLFIRGGTNPVAPSGFGLRTDPGFAGWSPRWYMPWYEYLDTNRGSSAQQDFMPGNTQAGPKEQGPVLMAASAPVAADFTLSGSITFNIRGWEWDATTNVGFKCRVYRYRPSDDSLTLVVASSKGTEMGLSQSASNWSATPTSTSFVVGDQIVLWVMIDDQGGTTTSGWQVAINYDGPTPGASGDSYITLTETVTFITATLGGSKFFLSDVASDISPDAGYTTKRLILDSRDDGVVSATVTGGGTSPVDWTISAGGSKIEWFTRPLNSFTFSGAFKVNLWASNPSAPASIANVLVELALTDQNGGNPTVIAKTLLVRTAAARETLIQQTSDNLYAVLAVPNFTVPQNGRLRIRAQNVDSYLYTGQQPLGGSNPSLRYGSASAGVDGDTYLELLQTVSEYLPLTQPRRKRLVGPQQLGSVAGTTVYTAPPTGAAWIRHIHVINPTGATRGLWLSIGPDGAASRHFDNRQIAPGEVIDQRREAEHWLNAGEVIQANADVAAACCIIVDGIEYA